MSNINTAAVQTEVQSTELIVVDRHAKHDLGDDVEIKVADSDKCISVYGITGRMPMNFTREQFELVDSKWEQIREYFEATRNNLLSREERKAEFQAKKSDAKLTKKQESIDEAKLLTLALQLAKAMQKA